MREQRLFRRGREFHELDIEQFVIVISGYGFGGTAGLPDRGGGQDGKGKAESGGLFKGRFHNLLWLNYLVLYVT